MSVRVKFAWYDLWVGAFIDRAKRTLYICPLPTLLIVVAFHTRPAWPSCEECGRVCPPSSDGLCAACAPHSRPEGDA